MTDVSPIQPPPRPQAPRPGPGPRKKAKAKAKKEGTPQAMLIAIGALVLVAGLMMWRRNASTPAELPARPAPGDATPTIIESPKQLKQMQAEAHKRTDILIAERAAGLQNLPLQTGKGHPTLKVQVKSMARGCAPGDWDIIRRDQEWRAAQKPQLVLSLEDLSGSGKPLQKPVTIDELRQGMTLEFPMESTKDRRLLGLFLCSTHEGRKCQSQTKPNLQDLSQLQTLIDDHMKEPREYPQDDKTFFFHLIVAYPDRILLHDTAQTLESSQNRLRAALEKGGKPVDTGLLQEAMERTRSAGSLPGVVLSDALQILLPHKGESCH